MGDWTIYSYLIELYPKGLLQKAREHKTPRDLAYHFGFKILGNRFEEERTYSVGSNNTLNVTEPDTRKTLISCKSSNNFGYGEKSDSTVCSINAYPLDKVSKTSISQCIMSSASAEAMKEQQHYLEIIEEKSSKLDSEKKPMDTHPSNLTAVRLLYDSSNHKPNYSWCGIHDPVTCRTM